MSAKKTTGILLICMPLIFASCSSSKELVILHTNDTHSQVEPLRAKDGTEAGGYIRRADFIAKTRSENKAVLVLDAGDFCQGTPYFNFFGGEVEAKALNEMKYDVVTLGNHEFDNGIESLSKVLSTLKMPVVCANYDASATSLAPYLKPYVVIKKKGLRIGIIGLCINPQGLIANANWQGIIYSDPVEKANFYAKELKEKQKCDMVIVLSHLGDDTEGMNDRIVAANSSNIDLIVGGHTHKLISNLRVRNLQNDSIPIVQDGKSAAYIGKLTVKFKK